MAEHDISSTEIIVYLLKFARVEKASKDNIGTRTTLSAREIFYLVLGFKEETSSTSYFDLLGAISERKDWILEKQEEMKIRENG